MPGCPIKCKKDAKKHDRCPLKGRRKQIKKENKTNAAIHSTTVKVQRELFYRYVLNSALFS